MQRLFGGFRSGEQQHISHGEPDNFRHAAGGIGGLEL